MHSWYGFLGTFTIPFRRFLEVRRTVKNLRCGIPSNRVSLFNLCSALIGDARGIFSSRWLNKIRHFSRGFFFFLNWDEQTSQRRGEIAWHGSSTAAPRVLSAAICPPAPQRASQLTQGLPERTLPSCTEQVEKASEALSPRAGTQASKLWEQENCKCTAAQLLRRYAEEDHLSKCLPLEAPYVKESQWS